MNLNKPVLATIIYYDILDFPLTTPEIFKFLINPERSHEDSRHTPASFGINPERIEHSISNLIKDGFIETRDGFYFLKGRRDIAQERIGKSKIAEEKWKKAKKYAYWLQVVPYIEIIFASGSLALGCADDDSDLDVLIVVQKNHIWLARIFLILATSFLGARRTKYDKVAPDKICLNHFITADSLRISFESIYNAQTYAYLTPLYSKTPRLVAEFYEQNKWVKDFLPNCDWPPSFQRGEAQENKLLRVKRKFLELLLDYSGLGWLLEKLARKIQKSRIDTDLPGRITISDTQLEFHPYSAEKEIINKFNQKISATGLFGDYRESDSGLR